MDLREQIRTTAMRAVQWRVALVCIVLAVVDGYEILVMAFVAPSLSVEWGLDNVTVGYLLSAGLIGMALGSVLLGPLADRIGRRKHILMCLALGAIGMALSGLATDVPTLMAGRAFSGLWLGAIVPSLNTIVSEYSSDRRRGTVMGVYGVGMPGGMVFGGLATGWLIEMWGWQGPFYFSAVVSAVMFIVTYLVLPESVEYLVERRPRNALRDYNKIARFFDSPAAAELPAPRGAADTRNPLRTVFTGTLLVRSILLWSSYALVVAALYFVNSWTPKMIADSTGNASDGRTVAILISAGGIVGSLVFAAFASRWNPRLVTVGLGVVALPIYFVFALVYDTSAGKVTAVLLGFVTISGMAALYAISPYVYPAASRGAAIGFMIGAGRGVSIAVPIAAGYLFAAGGTPALAFQISGVAMLGMGVLSWFLHRTYRGRTEDPEMVHLEDQNGSSNHGQPLLPLTTPISTQGAGTRETSG
ncbi:MFS transporter [Rhodococcus erythropolis]|uniref:MFS transporter n=1 Tax=Rhodococcus erythropolis TaxID=1833 RepID=UPI000698A62A|nr:MFS transporter [Rhodococcus erythropolis]